MFAAWCNLREAVPIVFGYMMSAKVGTGIVAELGAMRISDEIDALEVMGVDSMTFLCATRLLAAWIVLPFMYIAAIGVGVPRLLHRDRPSGRLHLLRRVPADLLAVPESHGLPVQRASRGMTMATAIVLVACYYGYNASGGPVGVGSATAKSMVLNLVLVNVIDAFGTQIFWGTNARAPIGG